MATKKRNYDAMEAMSSKNLISDTENQVGQNIPKESVKLEECETTAQMNVDNSDFQQILDPQAPNTLQGKQSLYKALSQRLQEIHKKNLQSKKKLPHTITIQYVKEQLEKNGYSELYGLDNFDPDIECIFDVVETKDGGLIIKYGPDMKEFAVVLNYYSPKGYDFVRSELLPCLPHPSALSKWYLAPNGEPGFTKESFEALQNYCHRGKMPACLMATKIELRQYRDKWGIERDGYVTYGPEEELARWAFVLMLVSLDGSYKLPVGYFNVNHLSNEQQSNILKRCIERCYDTGAEVVSLTLDSWNSTLSTARSLGCNFDNLDNLKTHFEHPVTKKPVTVMFDQYHTLHGVHLILEARTLIDSNGGKVKLQHLKSLEKVQCNVGQHFKDKISNRLFELRSIILNVKLPAEDLSKYAGSALKVCTNDLKLPEFRNADETIKFLEILSSIIDKFDTRKEYELPVNDTQELLQILDSEYTYLRSLRTETRTENRKENITTIKLEPVTNMKMVPGYRELLISISSMKTLIKELIEKRQILKYIPSHYFNLDQLVLFFTEIYIDKYRDPTTRQFKQFYKKIVQKLKHPSKLTQNHIYLEQIPVLNCTVEINKTTPGFRRKYIDYDDEGRNKKHKDAKEMKNCLKYSKMLDDDNLPVPMGQVVGYIAGYIVARLKENLDCPLCIQLLSAAKPCSFHQLISLHDNEKATFPSVVVFKICLATELFLKQLVKINDKDKILKEKRTILIAKSFAIVIENKEIKAVLQKSHRFDCLHDILFARCVIEEYLRVRLH